MNTCNLSFDFGADGKCAPLNSDNGRDLSASDELPNDGISLPSTKLSSEAEKSDDSKPANTDKVESLNLEEDLKIARTLDKPMYFGGEGVLLSSLVSSGMTLSAAIEQKFTSSADREFAFELVEEIRDQFKVEVEVEVEAEVDIDVEVAAEESVAVEETDDSTSANTDEVEPPNLEEDLTVATQLDNPIYFGGEGESLAGLVRNGLSLRVAIEQKFITQSDRDFAFDLAEYIRGNLKFTRGCW